MKIIDAMDRAYHALTTALTTHIYNAENGEAPEPGCEFVAAPDGLFQSMDNARQFGAFTYLEMEAALCVWECINDWTLEDERSKRQGWVELREAVGSVELRHASIGLGQWCLKVYDICTADEPLFFDGVSYDWDVIPMILGHAKNEDGPLIEQSALPDPAAIAAVVMEEHRRSEWFSSARNQAARQWSYADLISENEERAAEAYARGEEAAAFVKWLGEKYDLTPASEGW